jgi:putative pyruvate formate lyase activating enzyme
MWEEPCISGKNGSGTVFFTGCNLKCIFCQNRDISLSHAGLDISLDRLIEIFFELKEKGASNVNLVTPTHFTPSIADAIERAKARDIDIPFIWNSSGYENAETIELLRGRVDVFLPDLKYFSSDLSGRFSGAPDYFEKASVALEKMFSIVGEAVFDHNGMMKSGMIVRHLVLPGHTDDSLKVLSYLKSTFGNSIYVSIMNQYTPMPDASEIKELSRRLTTYEYEKVVNYALEIGITNGFIQDRLSASESFIPPFDYTGVLKK